MLNPNPNMMAKEQATRPVSTARILGLISDKLEATEEVFLEHLRSDVPFIQNAGEYIFSGGGKRVRPAMLLLSARLLGHDSDEEITYAAVVELIHTATLIHDDIIDHAEIRRGQTTVNQLWGNSLTVLLGDWLYTTSMEMALSHDNLEIVGRLCQATLRMTEGELLSHQRLGALDLRSEEYFKIIRRKTAHLFAACCSIPSLMQPRRPEAGQALHDYGMALGVCFQLVDDLLDYTADQSELGKPVLSDLKEGKLTLPLILALPRLDPARRKLVATVLEDKSFARVAEDAILEIVHSEGTIEEVGQMAQKYALEASSQLGRLPVCDAREALEFAPEFVLQRRS